MKLYTTYFANLKKLPKNIIPIAICGKSPDWYKGREYKKLAPKRDFFLKWKENNDNNYYIKCFNEQILQNLDVQEVYKELTNLITEGRYDIVLVCYETSDKFCHRHLVSKWLRDNGIDCEEII